MQHHTVLISLDYVRPQDPRTGLGIASIHATLCDAGHGVKLVTSAVNRAEFDVTEVLSATLTALNGLPPGSLVGFGAYTWNEDHVQHLLKAISQARPDVRLVVGGPQISFVHKGALEAHYPHAHLFVRGAGELPMLALANGTDPDRIHGVHVAGTSDRRKIAQSTLSELPSPHLTGALEPGAFVRWETQRGCPFECSFCQHREPMARTKRGLVNSDRIERELTLFAERDVTSIAVLDPIFHAKQQRAIDILRAARDRGLNARLSLQCRFETISDDFLHAASRADTLLEFGLQTIHENEGRAVRRINKMNKVDGAIQRLHDRNLPFEVSLIYGLPGQTLDSFRRSVDWCLDRRVPVVKAFPLMLLRGTILHAQRAQWNLVEERRDGISVVVQSDSFTRADHRRMESIATHLHRYNQCNSSSSKASTAPARAPSRRV